MLALAIGAWATVAVAADSSACAACHSAIYNSYRRTPMSASSGEAGPAQMERFERASFVHTASGFRYRVGRSSGRYFIEFEKTSDASLHGKKALAYFVGSGAVARSYLLAVGGFLYEAPVTYYSGAGKWDLAPGYDSYAYPFLTRPILPACLNCHASFLDVVQECTEPLWRDAVSGRRRGLRTVPRSGRSAHCKDEGRPDGRRFRHRESRQTRARPPR